MNSYRWVFIEKAKELSISPDLHLPRQPVLTISVFISSRIHPLDTMYCVCTSVSDFTDLCERSFSDETLLKGFLFPSCDNLGPHGGVGR